MTGASLSYELRRSTPEPPAPLISAPAIYKVIRAGAVEFKARAPGAENIKERA